MVIFSKGKPRKLSKKGVAGYQTKEILHYELTYLLSRKERVHQAEKSLELYEYLIHQLTEEEEILLDQFGGSCNMAKAATNLNRFSIVYELSSVFVKNAVERFGATTLYKRQFIEVYEESVKRFSEAGIKITESMKEKLYRYCAMITSRLGSESKAIEYIKTAQINTKFA